MALRAPLFNPSFFLPQTLKPQIHSIGSPIFPISRTSFKVSCKKKDRNKTSDAELAAELAAEMAKINTQLVQKEEAMKKSKELLFKEFCKYLGLEIEEVKLKWRSLEDNEKMGWAKGFVAEWGEAFHPLSSKSVKELVDEILVEENPNPISSSVINLDSLKKMIGF